MFKKVLLMAVILSFSIPCFAQSKDELVKNYNDLSTKIEKQKEIMANLRVKQIEIMGVLKYLEANEEKSRKNSAIHNAPRGE